MGSNDIPEGVHGAERGNFLRADRMDTGLFRPAAGLYNVLKKLFSCHNAVLPGVGVDSVPSLRAWTKQKGVSGSPFFRVSGPTVGMVLSAYIDVHDINKRPPLEIIVRELQKLSGDR